MRVKDYKPGEIIRVAGMEWVVLNPKHKTGGTLCVLKDILEYRPFSENDVEGCNNWAVSTIREHLNKYFILGMPDIKLNEVTTSLTSDDGMSDYGKTKDTVFLLSAKQYRKYRKYVPDVNDSWWLITPTTCDCNNSSAMRYVVPYGMISDTFACYTGVGVRPAVVFHKSVSVDAEDVTALMDTTRRNLREMLMAVGNATDSIINILDAIQNKVESEEGD